MSDNNDDQVPAVCEPCLGDNPYMRMVREKGGAQCHMCQRPYTVFRWVPQKKHPWKKTIICKSCSRVKNCCQSCMLDLTYGLPIAIRDEALKMATNSTAIDGSTDRTRLYAIKQQEEEYEAEEEDDHNARARDLLKRLANARDSSSTKKQSLVDELKEDASPSNPVISADIDKIASKLPFNGSMSPPPKDEKICSFFIYGVDEELTETDVRKFFGKYGEVKSVQVVHRAKCGFVIYSDRKSAESLASNISHGRFIIKGCKLRCAWGKPRPLGSNHSEQTQLASLVRKALKGKVKTATKKQKALALPQKQAESISNSNSSFEL